MSPRGARGACCPDWAANGLQITLGATAAAGASADTTAQALQALQELPHAPLQGPPKPTRVELHCLHLEDPLYRRALALDPLHSAAAGRGAQRSAHKGRPRR